MTDDKLYTSLSANTIMAKLDNHVQRTRLIISSTDKNYSLDSKDDFRSGCRNVSHQQQFFSELPSPGRSQYTNFSRIVSNISNTKDNVWPHFQTPIRELKLYTMHRKWCRKRGNLECWKPGNQEIWKSGMLINQGTRKSGLRETGKPGNLECRKPRSGILKLCMTFFQMIKGVKINLVSRSLVDEIKLK